MRRLVGLVAVIWLASHAVTLALVPTWFGLQVAGATPAMCMCSHGPAAVCPMHHRTDPDSRVCVWQGVTATADATLATLFTLVGLPTTSSPVSAPADSGRPTIPATPATADRLATPDAPPPRA